ncbi:DNA damage-regulated autophagy modulator protein 1 [Egretta garzetta]|nr:DNA damage-regulated autophagy modulator protein 1 [Egretta garzetta]
MRKQVAKSTTELINSLMAIKRFRNLSTLQDSRDDILHAKRYSYTKAQHQKARRGQTMAFFPSLAPHSRPRGCKASRRADGNGPARGGRLSPQFFKKSSGLRNPGPCLQQAGHKIRRILRTCGALLATLPQTFENAREVSFSSCLSDTGTEPPESGIFGFMINISALLGVITMYIRYLLIEKQNESSHFVRSSCNVFSLCIGLMGCIGMGIVATFQELSVPSVHDIGALVAFGSGVVYITLQSIISYKSCPQWNTYFVCHIRMAISVISCIAFIPMIVFASQISMTKIHWTPGEKDYTYHFLSAICEWTVAFGFIFFFLTFIRDFQKVSLRISTEIHEDS